MNDKPAKIEMVTLKQLCTELKLDPREARERLRLAVRDAKEKSRTREVPQVRAHMGVAQELASTQGSASRVEQLKHI